jgi:hypothetical protein
MTGKLRKFHAPISTMASMEFRAAIYTGCRIGLRDIGFYM